MRGFRIDKMPSAAIRSFAMRSPFLFWGFKSSGEILEKSLGALERDIMSVCWEQPETTVRDVCARLNSVVAYTTAMTTMDRLFKKGLLSRQKAGRAFVYSPTVTRDELQSVVATELVHSLLRRDGGEPLPILSSLVDAVSERDRGLLDELERLVRQKRRTIDREPAQ
jgi:predicted transcriptional regulator